MKSVQLVVVAAFTFSLVEMGTSQCDEAAAVHETLSPFMTEMREDLAAVKDKVDSLDRDLEEHKNKTTTELDQMNSKLDSLDSKQDSLSMTVMTGNSELEHNVLTNVTKEL